MKKQEINKLIAEKTSQAMALIKECEVLARDNDCSFDFEVAYGMGGTFSEHNEDCYYCDSEKEKKFGWHASSHSC